MCTFFLLDFLTESLFVYQIEELKVLTARIFNFSSIISTPVKRFKYLCGKHCVKGVKEAEPAYSLKVRIACVFLNI